MSEWNGIAGWQPPGKPVSPKAQAWWVAFQARARANRFTVRRRVLDAAQRAQDARSNVIG